MREPAAKSTRSGVPDVGRGLDIQFGRQQHFESRLQHADDLEGLLAESDDRADDRRVAAEAALPELVAENRFRHRRRRLRPAPARPGLLPVVAAAGCRRRR